MRIRRLNHSVYQLEYHLVWGTKYRRKIIKKYVRDELIAALKQIQKKYPDWYFAKINTGEDHVHLLLELPSKYSVAQAVQAIKSQSSLHLQKKFKYIREIYETKQGMWSDGYFASSVGLNEGQIKRYIDAQNNYDLGVDITSELS
jgi:putative transposase